MRILVHDYSGHPFQVQLSRALADHGHTVLHVHCASYQTGKGAVERRPEDPEGFDVDAIDLGRPFARYDLVRRLAQELRYGGAFAARARQFRPDVVLSSNDPLFAKLRAARWCRGAGIPWVFWLQDIYSAAMSAHTAARFGLVGRLLGRWFQSIEQRLLREAAAVVAITPDFLSVLEQWGVPADQVHVIENWAPLEDLDPRPKDNEWSRSHGVHDCPVLLYSGTLGLKHNPRLLLELAEDHRGDGTQVIVVSEGSGADWLAGERDARNLDNLVLLPYQPFDQLPDVLGSADVLLALLDPEAGVFSVPSKILTYLCAGRPILAAIPAENLGARTIERAGAGIVVGPDDVAAFVAGAQRLLSDAGLRHTAGEAARAHATATFDITMIAERFEGILGAARTSSVR